MGPGVNHFIREQPQVVSPFKNSRQICMQFMHTTTGCIQIFLRLKIFAPLRGAVDRGTRSDPEKVNRAFVRTHKTKRGPTTFGFIT